MTSPGSITGRFNPMRRRIPLLKRFVPSVKRRWWRLRHPGGWGILTSQGARFRLNPDNFVDRQIAFYDDYERAQLEHLSNVIAAMRCTHFFDVGAAFGYYSIVLATRFPTLAITAVEPDARNQAQLKANLALNGLDGRVTLHEAAATAYSGTVPFAPAAASSTGQSRVVSGGGAQVAGIALDDIHTAEGQTVAIKIDVEEHEPAVLRGMERMLRTNACVLQIESYREHVAEITVQLGALGYRLERVIEHDHYFVSDRDTGSRARTGP